MEVSYIAALTAGILSFLSPCVLPLVPPYLCFIAGTSLEQLTDGDDLDPTVGRRIFVSSLSIAKSFVTISFVVMHAIVTLRSTTGWMISRMALSTAIGTQRFNAAVFKAASIEPP